jgi:hypothetical protein
VKCSALEKANGERYISKTMAEKKGNINCIFFQALSLSCLIEIYTKIEHKSVAERAKYVEFIFVAGKSFV